MERTTMEKKPEVDGSWIEVAATDILGRQEEIKNSQIAVVTAVRIEMCGDDKKKFDEKLALAAKQHAGAIEGLDDEQKSFFLLRKMLLA